MSNASATPQLVEDLTLVFTDASSALPPWFGPVVVALLLAAGAAGCWGWRNLLAARRARRLAIAGFLDGPPEVWALRRLAELRVSTEILPPHPFALEVTEILRVFLERRFDLRAAHQSTEEFLCDARERAALSAEQQDRLREFLSCCDGAKFARRVLALERKRELLESAVRLVNESASSAAPDAPRSSRNEGRSSGHQEYSPRASVA